MWIRWYKCCSCIKNNVSWFCHLRVYLWLRTIRNSLEMYMYSGTNQLTSDKGQQLLLNFCCAVGIIIMCSIVHLQCIWSDMWLICSCENINGWTQYMWINSIRAYLLFTTFYSVVDFWFTGSTCVLIALCYTTGFIIGCWSSWSHTSGLMEHLMGILINWLPLLPSCLSHPLLT